MEVVIILHSDITGIRSVVIIVIILRIIIEDIMDLEVTGVSAI
jgi:hypothetical protein